VSELKLKLLELLREDAEFRLAVAGAVGLTEVLAELKKLSAKTLRHTKAIKSLQEQVAHHSEVLERHSKVLEEHTKAIKSLQEQVAHHSKILEEHIRAIQQHSEVLKRLSEAVQQHSRTLSAIGARWGVLAEEAFRDAMKSIIEKMFGGRAERWVYHDERGIVFGYPSWVEVDLVVRDGEHVLIEVKSSTSRGDIRELWAVGKLYEEVTGRKPRLAVVSPFIDRRGRELAEKLGIELYTGEEQLNSAA